MSVRLACFALLAVAAPAFAQPTVDVTFRFLPDVTPPPQPVTRVFVPGAFNGWGPNTGGQIAPGATSQATYDAASDEYRYTEALTVGQTYAYKLHYHYNDSGSSFSNPWPSDPLNAGTTDGDGNSLVTITDPMVFQIARETNTAGEIDSVSVGIYGTEAITSVTVTVNEDVYTSGIVDTGGGVYRLGLPVPVPVGSLVRVEVTDAQSRTTSAEVGVIPPDVIDRPVPDGIADGITYGADGTSATLVLRAPGKQYVYALGDFNNWTADASSLMFRDDTDPLGTRWWIEVDGLTRGPGAQAAFQYWIDGSLRVADPYAPIVHYPGESTYPAGAVEHAVGALLLEDTPFPWTDGDFQAPATEDLVVYELLLRDFVETRDFTALTDTLDYLERLGVNAIELMPVSEFDGDESWGYNPAFHLALDKAYGSPFEFKQFVDAAHARGIAVILDVVYNHATGQSPLVRLDNAGGFSAPSASNPWANPEARHPFNVFNDLNHESELTQIWLDQANRFWMDEYHVDGYRFDLSKGFTQTCGGGPCTDGNFSAYNPARIALLKRMADALWAAHPDAIVILEHFADRSEEQELAEYGTDGGHRGMTFWNNLNDAHMQAAMGYEERSSFVASYPLANGYPLSGQITYMESHDEQWMMYKNLAFGNSSGDYDVKDLETALDRQKLAGAFFLLTPGPRMLWQFGEAGFGGGPGECLKPNNTCPAGTPDRVGNKPIRWDYLTTAPASSNRSGVAVQSVDADERAERQLLYRTWAALLDLRKRGTLFSQPESYLSQVTAPGRWMVFGTASAETGDPAKAVVYGNFGVTPTTVTIPFAEAETWYGYFDDTEQTLAAGSHTFTLLPGEFHIWTDVDLPSPVGLIAVSTGSDAPLASGLQAVFPNPASSAATLRVALATPGDARLDVFDALGRRVATRTESLAQGTHDLALDAAALPVGVYLVRLTIDGGTETARLTVAR